MERQTDAWLDDIEVSSPCSADWNEMAGDDRRRFCEQCSLHVYDFSALTRTEAAELVQGSKVTGERLCGRYRRRADGTVLTRDCPVGLRVRLRRAASRVVAMVTAVFAFIGCRSGANDPVTETVDPGTSQPDSPPESPILLGEMEIMGDIALPETNAPEAEPATQPQPTAPKQSEHQPLEAKHPTLQGRIRLPEPKPSPKNSSK